MGIEDQFAEALADFRVHEDPFVTIREFRRLCLEQVTRVASSDDSSVHDWELETKLWDLVELLYEFRYRIDLNQLDTLPEYPFSSLCIKQENWLLRNPQFKQLQLVILWIQRNTSGFDDEVVDAGQKWGATRRESASGFDMGNYVDSVDADAQITSDKLIHPSDESTDTAVIRKIYHLVLANEFSEAINVANDTGNYALALILVGAVQEYKDPEIDGGNPENDPPRALGVKHKLTWKRTTYQLSQLGHLNRYERMIYTYLTGGDISSNIEDAAGIWEPSLLLYCQQILAYHLEKFWMDISNTKGEPLTALPQFADITEIITSLPKMSLQLRVQCQEPARIIDSLVITNQEHALFQDVASTDAPLPVSLVRVVTHLAIIHQLVFKDVAQEDFDSARHSDQITADLIKKYTSILRNKSKAELVPVYFSFVIEETERREAWSRFLSNMTEPTQRQRQLEILRKVGNHSPIDFADDQMSNVYHCTVELALNETHHHYQRQGQVELEAASYDENDERLINAVDWYYLNKMYRDFLAAGIVVMQRFLAVGKLGAVVEFARGKNFTKILKDYDRLTIADEGNALDEGARQEFIQYANLINGIQLIDEFHHFVEKGSEWNEKVDPSLEKISATVGTLIETWFSPKSISAPDSETATRYASYRQLYVPYFIFELLKIYVAARARDWQYMEKAFELINSVADECHDYLGCFVESDRLTEFVATVGEVATIGLEKGVKGIFQ